MKLIYKASIYIYMKLVYEASTYMKLMYEAAIYMKLFV